MLTAAHEDDESAREELDKMKKSIALVCTVWGDEFTDFFCDYSLATLFSCDNMPWLSRSYEVTLLIYTYSVDFERMQRHKNFQKLTTSISIKPIFFESITEKARSGHWVQWQHAVAEYNNSFFAFIMIIPDCLFASNCLRQVAEALETVDIVYYSVPQICRELVIPYLAEQVIAVKGADQHTLLDIPDVELVKLFVKYINPKHSSAVYRPDFLMSHPEYVIQQEPGCLTLTETVCHPIALRGNLNDVSYTFNPKTDVPTSKFLDILALGCEYTLKFIEQYYRWPHLNMQLSRCVNLGSWAYTFRERGADSFSDTETEVRLAGLEVLAQGRRRVSNPRVLYQNAMLDFQATLFRIYLAVLTACAPEVGRAVGLAMCLPGFRRRALGGVRQRTLFLPVSEGPLRILDSLLEAGDPNALMDFLLLHTVAGRLSLKVGECFKLEPGSSIGRGSTFQALDPALAEELGEAVIGKIVAHPQYLTDDIIAYSAAMRYGTPQKPQGG